MTDYKGVAVYCEVKNGKLMAIAAEGLGIGRKLASNLGQELSAVIVGSEVVELAQEAIACVAGRPTRCRL